MNLLTTVPESSNSYQFIDLSNPNYLAGFIGALVLFVLLDLFFFFTVAKKIPLFLLIPTEILVIVFYVFKLDILTYISIGLFAAMMVLLFYVNSHDLHFLYHSFTGRVTKALNGKNSKKEPEVLIDREAMYAKINDAVQYFSSNKVGALITFERNDSLNEFMSNGVILDARVSSALLKTIFYVGTYLHDGAVIIRNDRIYAASCMFEPSKKPMSGKMGLRHRAAVGISEVCDAVTVVVSEETGRISIAYGGDIEPVPNDEFVKVFSDFMALGFEHRQ